MNIINDIYTILKTEFLDNFSSYLNGETRAVAYILLVFTICNCFFGYHLRKLWSCLFGSLLGFVLAASITIYLGYGTTVAYAVGLISSIVLLILSFLLYRIGMFLLCAGAVAITLYQFFPLMTIPMLSGLLVFSIVIAILCIPFEIYALPILTAVCGGTGSAGLILRLLGRDDNSAIFYILVLIFSVLGSLFQFYTTKNNRQRELEKSKHKHNGLFHFNNKRRHRRANSHGLFSRKKRRKKETIYNTETETQPRQTQQNTTKHTQQHHPKQTKQSNPRQTQQSTSKQTQQGNPKQTQQGNSKQIQQSNNNTRNQYPIDKDMPDMENHNHPVDAKDQTVDLSDVRASLSKEIKEIYDEQNK